MANYNTELSFAFHATEAECEFAQCLSDLIDGEDKDGLLSMIEAGEIDRPEENFIIKSALDFFEELEWFGCYVGRIVEAGKPAIWIHSEETASIDAVIAFVQTIMTAFDWPADAKVGFEWADTCDKPRLDAFGGGAAVVTKNGHNYINTSSWLYDKTKA